VDRRDAQRVDAKLQQRRIIVNIIDGDLHFFAEKRNDLLFN